ncbi:MAG TPA: hypothetical protein VGR10_00065 [Thermoleophilaceae bacterium]|nr:hypothetical protein [Thermoleophilaceae bacterium]
MNGVHAAVGIAVIALNALAGGWGGVAWLRQEPSVIFWYLLRAAQVVVVLQVALGLGLLLTGREAPDELHVIYGLAPLVVSLVSEGMRVGAAQRELEDAGDLEGLERTEQAAIARRVVRREMGVMSVGALLIVTLALRAAFATG